MGNYPSPQELLIAAEDTFTGEFTPKIGRFQASADGGSLVTLQIAVGALGWTNVATIALTTGGISVQEQVDERVRWRIGVALGDYTADVQVRLGQA